MALLIFFICVILGIPLLAFIICYIKAVIEKRESKQQYREQQEEARRQEEEKKCTCSLWTT